ncbi:MAG: pirin family protein, partial [Pseudomonadales bacterium]|nr:pirin family protein [Pseudomonadales bacterium]
MKTRRHIEEVLQAQQASDGAGVKLKRVFGGQDLVRFDPFLMLDEFGSEEAADYIGGFPPHPHRGFETVTYMLEGYMEHRDHMDNVGKLGPGDVQWMKAGSGVIHSEMPQQEEGRMRGFQLWVNLPA